MSKYKFSKKSKERLETCHPDLQKVLNIAIQYHDFTILEGHRDKETQDKYYAEGKSKLKFPEGKHNSLPSKAVDLSPYPIDWENSSRFHSLANRIIGIGLALGIKLRYGGDWDNDLDIKDNGFDDLVHIELID